MITEVVAGDSGQAAAITHKSCGCNRPVSIHAAGEFGGSGPIDIEVPICLNIPIFIDTRNLNTAISESGINQMVEFWRTENTDFRLSLTEKDLVKLAAELAVRKGLPAAVSVPADIIAQQKSKTTDPYLISCLNKLETAFSNNENEKAKLFQPGSPMNLCDASTTSAIQYLNHPLRETSQRQTGGL